MIDETLLRQLGWSEELIKEVNRISDDINRNSGRISEINESVPAYESISGNTINYVSKEIDSGSDITVNPVKGTEI